MKELMKVFRNWACQMIYLGHSILGYFTPPAKEMMKKHKKEHHKEKKDGKVKKVMEEFSEGKLHSGSKKGPEVTNRKQAVAIALSEARKAGEKVSKKK